VKFNSIIFDWDGTLCQTLGLWVEGYRQGLNQLGISLQDDDIVQDFLHDHAQLEARYPSLRYDNLLTLAQEFVFQNIATSQLYDGVMASLDHLANLGVKTALVSTSPRHVLLAGVRAHGLEHRFSFILAGDEVARIKPDPEPFQTALRAINSDPSDTLIIGDNRSDILAGRAAGTKTCLFAPHENQTYHDFDDLRRSGADFEIDHLQKLQPLNGREHA